MHPTMRTVKTLFSAGILCFTCLAATPAADTNEANQVIQAALQPSSLEANLHRLTDEIGGRVPGTAAMQHAIAWGVQAFTAAGADSVHTEGFTIPNSWAEGATEMTATTAYQVDAYEGGRRDRALAIPRARGFGGLGARAGSGEARSGR